MNVLSGQTLDCSFKAKLRKKINLRLKKVTTLLCKIGFLVLEVRIDWLMVKNHKHKYNV